MIVVAFWAFIAWCATQAGFDNGTFWFVVGVLAVVSALFIRLARDEFRRRRALRITVPVLMLSFLTMSITLFVDSALLTIAASFLARQPRPSIRALSGVCIVSAMIALAGGVMPGIVEGHRLEMMRREFPIVSLERRLQYEKHRTLPMNPRDAIVDDSAMVRLIDWEQELEMRAYRRDQFKRLHDYHYELFVRSTGFGVGRMPLLGLGRLRRPSLRDIRFDDTAVDKAGVESDIPPDFLPSEKSYTVEDLHKVSRKDFLSPIFWGAVIEPPLKVSGFVEHGFHVPPTATLKDVSTWTIERLELVSLLRFGEPRVYVLDHLPRMDQLSSDNVPTRSLDSFESKSLAQLWADEDVVVSHERNEYRMLGSLRAARQCLECHSVQRGELLGAFSYSLRRNLAEEEHVSLRK
jgi:hypothetical protein